MTHWTCLIKNKESGARQVQDVLELGVSYFWEELEYW